MRAIKENLQSCKNLLHCKRDELRKLWIEGIENKTIYAMMDEIEKVKDVGDRLRTHIDNRHYLHCTSLIVSSLSVLEGDLANVEGLRDIKNELLAKKEELYDILIDELNRQIYQKSTSSVVKGFQRQGSTRQSHNRDKMSYLKLALKNSSQANENLSAEEEALKKLMEVNLSEITAPHAVIGWSNRFIYLLIYIYYLFRL